MDETASRRVKLLRFPLILLVLYIHSYIAPIHLRDATVALAPAPWLLVLQMAWSNGVARVAVPLFFLTSGYLYFLGFDGSLTSYCEKLRRRLRTLLVPYLFWNVLTFTLFALGQAWPATSAYFDPSHGIAGLSPFDKIDMVLGLTHYPIAYPFWFIRDLMLIALSGPLIHVLIARLGIVVPAVLFVWLVLGLPSLPMPSMEALAYFVIGAWLASTERELFPPARWLRWLLPLYMVVLASDVALRTWVPGEPWVYSYAVAVGVVTTLALTAWVERHLPSFATQVMALSGASFSVFAAHEPLMTLLRKVLYRLAPASQALILAVYALLPIALAAMLVLAYFVLRRLAPRFTALIAGGR